MRQIKFRAWHIKDKCYCESVSCGAMSIVGYDIHEIFNNDIIFEQFTGLLDKEGREIYEGDTIERPDCWPIRKGSVIFKNGKFVGDFPEDKTHKWEAEIICLPFKTKVIGNIHEEQK